MSKLWSRIRGLGVALPSRKVTNEDLAGWMDTSDEWIRQRTGIAERYWVDFSSETSASELAREASERALADAGLSKDALDLIVFATLSPDAAYPGSGCFLQGKLDLPGIPALDIRQQCTGWIYGLSIADLYVRSGQYENVLLVGSEIQSKSLDISNRGRSQTVLFGDGAGAVIVSRAELADLPPSAPDARVLSCHLHADGRHAKDLLWAAPGSANRIWNPPELVGEPESYPQMNGRLVFQHATKRMPEVALEALEAHGLAPDDVDLFVNHQANKRIDDRFAEALGVPPEKVVSTIAKYGNTSAATIPLGLWEARADGRLQPGMLVCSAAFGAGFTWGAALLRW